MTVETGPTTAVDDGEEWADTPEDAAFRKLAREFLEGHAPQDGMIAHDSTVFFDDEEEEMDFVARSRAWQRIKYDHGWAGVDWPAEYGGRGGTERERVIFEAEERKVVSRWLSHNLGFAICGPPILHFGTEELKQRLIPRMLSGQDAWAQLFSEPGAGSDLGGLRTAAVRDGDEWVVNGQKVWSSKAHFSQRGLLVARTDFEADKYRGITIFALDLSTPGVDVRPIRQMNGACHFNETFMSEVRIPDADRIGEVNAGWGIALSTLTGERSSLGNVGGGPAWADILSMVQRSGHAGDPVVRQRAAFVYARQRVFEFLVARAHEAAQRGAKPGPEGSVLKLALSRLVAEISDFAVDTLGVAGTLSGPEAFDQGRWTRELNGHFSYRIGGGTDQIQRNTIGEKVLGLAGEPRVDKGVPFRSIPS